MARLTKTQLEICSHLNNGGWIWTAAGHAYVAAVDKDGRIRSAPLNNRVFTALLDNQVIAETNPNRYDLISKGV